MSEPFLSSDDYDERAHQLYNEGHYDEAIEVLREGLGLYPHTVELHVGMGYARLAREEYLWARRAFEEAIGLDPDHEDALAGLGEVLLKFGDRAGAVGCFDRIVALGFRDDHDLMLQVGRALFREGLLDHGASRLGRGGGVRGIRGPPAQRRRRRAVLAAPRPRARRAPRRGPHLPRQPAVRPGRIRGCPVPSGAHRARRPLRRPRNLAPDRAEAERVPAP